MTDNNRIPDEVQTVHGGVVWEGDNLKSLIAIVGEGIE